MGELRGIAALLPVKAFSVAKRRLEPALDAPQRAALARAMATHVVRAAAPLAVYVACDDPEVAAWAEEMRAVVLWSAGLGLNAAVQAGLGHLGALGVRRVVVAHADLPLAERLDEVAAFDGITLVPDRRQDGTNVLCVPTGASFDVAYGPGSFRRHYLRALASGHALRVLRRPRLAWDVDEPVDLWAATGWLGSPIG